MVAPLWIVYSSVEQDLKYDIFIKISPTFVP